MPLAFLWGALRLPNHAIFFFAGLAVQALALNLKLLSAVKCDGPGVLLVDAQFQPLLSGLCIAQQLPAYPAGLRLATDEDAGDIAAAEPDEALNFPLLFIDVYFRQRQSLRYFFKMIPPVLRGNKIVRC